LFSPCWQRYYHKSNGGGCSPALSSSVSRRGNLLAACARSDMKITHTKTSATHPPPATSSPRRQITGKSHMSIRNHQTARPAEHAATGQTRLFHYLHSALIRVKTWSAVRESELMTMASEAARRGETSRVESMRSRSVTPARTVSYSAWS